MAAAAGAGPPPLACPQRPQRELPFPVLSALEESERRAGVGGAGRGGEGRGGEAGPGRAGGRAPAFRPQWPARASAPRAARAPTPCPAAAPCGVRARLRLGWKAVRLQLEWPGIAPQGHLVIAGNCEGDRLEGPVTGPGDELSPSGGVAPSQQAAGEMLSQASELNGIMMGTTTPATSASLKVHSGSAHGHTDPLRAMPVLVP
ncbi:hypothetical protein VULLAG_LOCUS10520 [Vulpes lagopus]